MGVAPTRSSHVVFHRCLLRCYVCLALILTFTTFISYIYTRAGLWSQVSRFDYLHQKTSTLDEFTLRATQTTMTLYNHEPIQEFCNQRQWNNNIAIDCERIFGGIGNVRQRILICIRHAMQEGWSAVIPSIELRSLTDLSSLENGTADLGYVFDRNLFIHRLSGTCPGMRLYGTVEEATSAGLEIFVFATRLAQLSICESDTAAFALNLGGLLLFSPKLYRLAFAVLYALTTRIQPPDGGKNSLGSAAARYPFLGIHLRTSEDAVKAGWTDFEQQTDHYLDIATKTTHSTIYVASGNATSVTQFAERTRSLPLKTPPLIVTKEGLLSGLNLLVSEQLAHLTWDQKAVIDYIVLSHADFFAGFGESSFTWNVVVARAAAFGGEDAVCDRGRHTEHVEEGVVWSDTWSDIAGFVQSPFNGRLWP